MKYLTCSFDKIRLGRSLFCSFRLCERAAHGVEIRSRRVFVCVVVCVCEWFTNPSTELKRVKNTSKGSLTSVKPHRVFKNNKWSFSSLFPGGIFSPLRLWLFPESLEFSKKACGFIFNDCAICVTVHVCLWKNIGVCRCEGVHACVCLHLKRG